MTPYAHARELRAVAVRLDSLQMVSAAGACRRAADEIERMDREHTATVIAIRDASERCPGCSR